MIGVQIRGDDAVADRFASMAARVHDKLLAAVTTNGLALQAHVMQDKLSGQVLKVRSGTLRDSIALTVMDDGDGIVASLGTEVKYAAIQEYGGKTAPHVIAPRDASVLAFRIGGKTIFAKRVQHPGSRMLERSFLRSALADQADQIRDSLRAAVGAAVEP
jgi:phage gpG-like protein